MAAVQDQDPEPAGRAGARAARSAARPGVDVVVPFAGSGEALGALAEGLSRLELGPGDTLTVVDNRRRDAGTGGAPAVGAAAAGAAAGPPIVAAGERQGSYYARNRGAAGGGGEWLLFMDADVEAPADLLDRFFEPLPGEAVGVLAGEIVDEQVGGRTHVGRFLARRASMSQSNTLREPWPYAQTANCAVRRAAFEAVGGFDEEVRSGGDADLCFRLRAAGWELERRGRAVVAHRARSTVRAMIAQRARHGAGAAWLERRYPGSFPAQPRPALARWTAGMAVRALGRLLRGDRGEAAALAVEAVWTWAFELGRLRSNHARARR